MAMIEISPAGAPGATPPGALVLKNRFEPAAPLSGTILPSLLDETLLEAELSLAAYDGVEDFSGAVSVAAGQQLTLAELKEMKAAGIENEIARLDSALTTLVAEGWIKRMADSYFHPWALGAK